MLKERRNVAQQLTNRLFETESAIDEAISKMADLTGYMPIARESAKLSAVVGQDAFIQAAQTMTALVEARSQIVETHHRLAETRVQIGLRTMAMGTGYIKPPAAHKADNVVELSEKAA